MAVLAYPSPSSKSSWPMWNSDGMRRVSALTRHRIAPDRSDHSARPRR